MGAPQPGLPLYNPTNIAIAANGDLYVADGYGSYYIGTTAKASTSVRLEDEGRTRAS